MINNNIFYFYRMQPLNPALLDNNNNNGFSTNKKQFNRTIKNQKNLTSNMQNNPVLTTSTTLDKGIMDTTNPTSVIDKSINNQQPLNKITQVDDIMKSIFNQNNESINSGTIFDINSDAKDNRLDNISSNLTDVNNDNNVRRQSQSLLPGKMYNPENITPSNSDSSQYTDVNNLTTLNSNMINPKRDHNKTNTELLEKLNYVIYLLEEQRAQKSNYVTEEIILYIFLGIFIIFVLDKFSRPGKYTR